MSEADPRVVYKATVDPCAEEQVDTRYYISYSSDAGATWEQRYQSTASCRWGPVGTLPPSVQLETIPNAPVTVLLLTVRDTSSNSGRQPKFYVSGDAARSFTFIGSGGQSYSVAVGHTHEGLLRVNTPPCDPGPPCPPYIRVATLSLSTDGGRSWERLPGPPLLPPPGSASAYTTALGIAIGAPSNVFLSQGQGKLWYSPDGGHSWQEFEDYAGRLIMHISPYLPLTVLGVKDNRLYVLELPEAGKKLSAPAPPNNASVPNGLYFSRTGHNLWGAFKGYWEQNGGLAQQGYPLTEPFREVSNTDGRVYLTQYFERAVFEYHPENAAPNDVLLSLLGVFEYKHRYGQEGATGQQPNNSPGSVFFPQTGKRLGGSFLQYWQSHGSLRQQGYPISDEFEERSELDGKMYRVQYFERAVFEYHPEHAGTLNEVLLSQLGTFRLRDKYGAAMP